MSDIYAITHSPQFPPEKKPPVVILLHGFGSNERDLIGLTPYLDQRLHVVSARGIYDIGYGGYAWYYLYGVPPKLQHDNASRAHSLEVLTTFVAELPHKVGIDDKQVYLLGFSQGAAMSLSVALTAPHLVAGVVIISGFLDDQVAPTIHSETLTGLDVLVIHGTLDDLIPISRGREIRDYLKTKPVCLDYYEYPIGHGIHPDSLSIIQQWLSKQIDRRNNQDEEGKEPCP